MCIITEQEINDAIDAKAPRLEELKGDIRNLHQEYKAYNRGDFFVEHILDAVDIEI